MKDQAKTKELLVSDLADQRQGVEPKICRTQNDRKSISLIFLGFAVGLFSWIMEAAMHTIVFQDGNYIAQVFFPDRHELWMRLLIVFCFISFGVYSQLTITKRRRAEEALRAERDMLELLTGNMSVGIATISKDFRTIYANKILKGIFGDVEGKVCYRAYNKRDKICPGCGIEEVFRNGADQVVHEQKGRDRDGNTIWSQIIASPIREGNGNIDSALEVVVPITERKAAEEAMRESEMRLKNAQAVGHMGDWEYEVSTKKISWSDEVFNLYKRDPSLGPPTVEEEATYYLPEDTKRLREYGRRAIEEGESFDYDVRVKLPGGKSAYMMGFMRPIKDESGRVVKLSGTIQDITERKKSEHKLLDYQRQLRNLTAELSRVEEKERREIATELHDRIGQALAMSKIKVSQLEESLSASDFCPSIKTVRELLDQAIQDIRNLTFEISSPILYELGLEEAVDWLVEQMQRQYGMQINFTCYRQPKPLEDEIRFVLFKAVRELLINVAKHAQTKKATLSIKREGKSVRIEVMDKGIGFDISKLDMHISKAIGFGLFSIRERLNRLGGGLNVQSGPGKGTQITINAPVKIV